MTGHQVTVQYFESAGYIVSNYQVNPLYEVSDSNGQELVLMIQKPFRWKLRARKYTTKPEGYFYIWTFWSQSEDREKMTKVVQEVMRKLPLTFPLEFRLVYNKPYCIPGPDMWDPDKIIEHLRNGRE